MKGQLPRGLLARDGRALQLSYEWCDHRINADFDQLTANSFEYLAADGREIPAAEYAVQLRERLTVHQRHGSDQRAHFEGLAEVAAGARTGQRIEETELQLMHASGAGNGGAVDVFLAGECRQRTNQLVARLEHQHETKWCLLCLHETLLGSAARKIATYEPGGYLCRNVVCKACGLGRPSLQGPSSNL